MPSEPAYLRAFKDFAKQLPDIYEREEMEKEFYGESDRACGILFASWVELMIERAIKIKLKRVPAPLFDFQGPLGTFSAKIIVAYALGLFGSKTNHDLLLIRTMRNEFAHCQKALQFDIPQVKSVCDHLILPDIAAIRAIPKSLADRPVDRHGWHDKSRPRTRFVVCCYTIISGLFNWMIREQIGDPDFSPDLP